MGHARSWGCAWSADRGSAARSPKAARRWWWPNVARTRALPRGSRRAPATYPTRWWWCPSSRTDTRSGSSRSSTVATATPTPRPTSLARRCSPTWPCRCSSSSACVRRADLGGELEPPRLLRGPALDDVRRAQRGQRRQHAADDRFGRRGAGGQTDPGRPGQPVQLDGRLVLDQASGGAVALGDLDQAPRVGRVGGADDQHEVALTGQELDGVLAILGRVADVAGRRSRQPGKALAQRIHDLHGVVDREGGLGQIGDPLRILHLQALDLALV